MTRPPTGGEQRNRERIGCGGTSTDLPEHRPQHSQQVANSEDASSAGADVQTTQTPTTSEWQQAQANRSKLDFWVFVVRHPDMFEDQLNRSELLQLIEASDDVRLLRALSMGSKGVIAERAQQRLTRLAQAIVGQDTEARVSLAGEEDASPSRDPAFYLARSLRHFRRGNFDRAITDCDEAIRLEPGQRPGLWPPRPGVGSQGRHRPRAG